MKRIITLIGTVILAVTIAAVVRAALHRWAPALYSAVWGQTIRTEHVAKSALSAPEQTKIQQPPVYPEQATKVPPSEHTEDPIYMTGKLWKRDGTVLVVMSDGTNRSIEDNTEPDNPRVQRIMRRFMDFQGKRYYLTPRKDPPKEQQVAKREDLPPKEPIIAPSEPVAQPHPEEPPAAAVPAILPTRPAKREIFEQNHIVKKGSKTHPK